MLNQHFNKSDFLDIEVSGENKASRRRKLETQKRIYEIKEMHRQRRELKDDYDYDDYN